MPHSEMHKKKLKKNLAVSGLVFLWCAVIWLVTMIRMANAADDPNPFADARAAHLEKTDQTQDGWEENYSAGADARNEQDARSDEDRAAHTAHIDETQAGWEEDWQAGGAAREAAQATEDERRSRHLETTTPQPEQWWEQRAQKAENP